MHVEFVEFAVFAMVSVLLVAELALFFALGFLTGKSKAFDPPVLGFACAIVVLSGFSGVFLYVVRDDTSLLPMAAIAAVWAVGMGVGRIFRKGS